MTWWKWVIIIVLCIGLVVGIGELLKLTGCAEKRSDRDPAQSVRSDSVLTIYNEKTRTDTVVRWYEKPFISNPKVEVVYVQKVDTVYIEKWKNYDLFLSVEKVGNTLLINAVNINGQIIKSRTYNDVGQNFTATAQDSNIFIKSQRFYWEGLRFTAGYNFGRVDSIGSPLKFNQDKLSLGVKTGYNYMDKLALSAYLKFYPTVRLMPDAGLELEYRIK